MLVCFKDFACRLEDILRIAPVEKGGSLVTIVSQDRYNENGIDKVHTSVDYEDVVKLVNFYLHTK